MFFLIEELRIIFPVETRVLRRTVPTGQGLNRPLATQAIPSHCSRSFLREPVAFPPIRIPTLRDLPGNASYNRTRISPCRSHLLELLCLPPAAVVPKIRAAERSRFCHLMVS